MSDEADFIEESEEISRGRGRPPAGKVPINTTLNYELATWMREKGISFSSALTIGVMKIQERHGVREPAPDAAKVRLAQVVRRVAASLERRGLHLDDLEKEAALGGVN